MSALRTKVPDFELANPLYVGAQVSFYGVDVDGVSTGVLATLYAEPTGTATLTNPQRLDSEGKFSAPVYIADPVIAEVTGANVGSHTTGVISPLRGTWRGDWVTGTVYRANDFLQNPATFNIYVVAADYTSGASVAADISANHLVLVFSFTALTADAAQIAAAVAASAASASAAAASASAAATSASAASTSASAASTSASAASTSASAAATSATAAAASAATATTASRGLYIVNGYIEESHAVNAVTFTVKTLAGATPSGGDPVLFVFPTSTGTLVVRTVTAALSLTVSSGSTLGTSNSVPFRLWIVAFDDAGTVRLGVIKCLAGTAAAGYSIYQLGQYPFASSTAEGGAGAADSAQVFYTGTAVGSKAYSVLASASWETGLAAAGTWNASPTRPPLMFGAGSPLPGTVIQTAQNQTGAVATGSTAFPMDDTIPQSTEGDQYMSQAIVPSSASNILDIHVRGVISGSIASTMASALFQDAAADALAASNTTTSAAGGHETSSTIRHRMLAGLSVSTTFKWRASANGATTTFNGSAGGRIFGGAMNSYMDAQELVA